MGTLTIKMNYDLDVFMALIGLQQQMAASAKKFQEDEMWEQKRWEEQSDRMFHGSYDDEPEDEVEAEEYYFFCLPRYDDIPDLGHQKPGRRNRFAVIAGSRVKRLHGKRGGEKAWKVSREKKDGRLFENKDAAPYQRKLRKMQDSDFQKALGEEVLPLLQSKRPLARATFGKKFERMFYDDGIEASQESMWF